MSQACKKQVEEPLTLGHPCSFIVMRTTTVRNTRFQQAFAVALAMTRVRMVCGVLIPRFRLMDGPVPAGHVESMVGLVALFCPSLRDMSSSPGKSVGLAECVAPDGKLEAYNRVRDVVCVR